MRCIRGRAGEGAMWLGMSALIALCGCQDPQIQLPASIKGPVEMAISQGEVCLRFAKISDDGLYSVRTDACRQQDERIRERGAIGLVANIDLDRVAVVALDESTPLLADLDLAVPGVTHIPVGRRPISIDASPDGTLGYTANQLSRDVSIVNLWSLQALDETLPLSGLPIRLRTHARTGEIAVVQVEPSLLSLHPGLSCARPESFPLEVGQHPASQGCEGLDAAWTDLSLPGTPRDLALDPLRSLAYVLYTDRPWLSVVALDEEGRGDQSCLEGTQAPCEVERVGLTAGCADGLDNDGDGFIDQQDPQCYGPLGAESSDGVGMRLMAGCADGLDDDGDGLIDRDDPDCLIASQASEDAQQSPDYAPALRACGDGLDNDGDGLIDLLDPDCYGSQGGSELALPEPGVGRISVDELGVFAYVTRPKDREVLIVDLARRRLIDAPRNANVPDPFAERLGVSIGRSVSPTALTGRIRRTVTRDPREEYAQTHALITYDLGAQVVGDNGYIFYVEAGSISCDLWEPDGILTEDVLFLSPWELSGRYESQCLTLPELPLAPILAPSCEEVILCDQCITSLNRATTEEGFEACAACDLFEDATQYAFLNQSCQAADRVLTRGVVRRVFNPAFQIPDARLTDVAQQQGRAECDQPDALLQAVQEYIAEHPEAPRAQGCGAPLVSQPLSVTVPTRGNDAPVDFSSSQRVDLLERRTLRWAMGSDGEVTSQLVVSTDDFAVREESWSVVYEGVLPGTRRGDGLLVEGAPDQFDIGAMNPCLSDVQVGDHLILRSEPGTETGGVPSGCEVFQSPEQATTPWREYEVVEVRVDRLTLQVIPPEEGEAATTVQELPRLACFPRGLDYEVRAQEEWIVYGSSSGIASGRVAHQGVCVPGNGAGSPRANSRVRSGERYVGPQVSFWMYPGVVPPVRDTSYTINVSRNAAYVPASSPELLTFTTAVDATAGQGINLSQLLFERFYSATPNSNGEWPYNPLRLELLLGLDPSADFIFVQEPVSKTTPAIVR